MTTVKFVDSRHFIFGVIQVLRKWAVSLDVVISEDCTLCSSSLDPMIVTTISWA